MDALWAFQGLEALERVLRLSTSAMAFHYSWCNCMLTVPSLTLPGNVSGRNRVFYRLVFWVTPGCVTPQWEDEALLLVTNSISVDLLPAISKLQIFRFHFERVPSPLCKKPWEGPLPCWFSLSSLWVCCWSLSCLKKGEEVGLKPCPSVEDHLPGVGSEGSVVILMYSSPKATCSSKSPWHWFPLMCHMRLHGDLCILGQIYSLYFIPCCCVQFNNILTCQQITEIVQSDNIFPSWKFSSLTSVILPYDVTWTKVFFFFFCLFSLGCLLFFN